MDILKNLSNGEIIGCLITLALAIIGGIYKILEQYKKKKEEGYNSIGTYELSSYAFATDGIKADPRVHFKVTSGQIRISDIEIVNQNNSTSIILNESEFKNKILLVGNSYNIITLKTNNNVSLNQDYDNYPIINITYSDINSKYYKIDTIKILYKKNTTELISSKRI